MKLKRFSGGTLGLLAVTALTCGCSSKSNDCNANLSCQPFEATAAGTTGSSGDSGSSSGSRSGNGGASGETGNGGRAGTLSDAGTSGEAGVAGAANTCNGSLSPEVESCVISDDFGVFVSPDGTADGDGTEAAPFPTLTKALAALDKKKRIYVCAAEYVEPDTLEIPSGVSIYGGFNCDGGAWTYDATSKSSFLPQSPIGAEIHQASNVTLQDLSITAQGATGFGASSFGMTVVDSDGVVLTRVGITAGKGGAGKEGDNGDAGTPGVDATAEQNGQPGTCVSPSTRNGGNPLTPICTSQGGKGGDGVVSSMHKAVQDGDSGYPDYSVNGGLGGAASGDPGNPGAIGKGGANGTLGSAALPIGSFSATGYAVANGSIGTAGKPGQGGGGGGASTVTSACAGSGGGAGGMGGCGGQPGTGGSGGGASVALLSWRSSLTMDTCALTALVGGGGGNGGVGGLGGTGKVGGAGGNPDPPQAGIKVGGAGGLGGDGGDGGSGAGGTGGPSIALVYDGIEPIRKNTALQVPTNGGAAGIGGHLGEDDTKWGPDGSVGLVQDVYPKQQ